MSKGYRAGGPRARLEIVVPRFLERPFTWPDSRLHRSSCHASLTLSGHRGGSTSVKARRWPAHEVRRHLTSSVRAGPNTPGKKIGEYPGPFTSRDGLARHVQRSGE